MQLNEKRIYDQWANILRESAGIKDEYKLRWLSKYANNHQIFEAHDSTQLNESYLAASFSNVNGMGSVSTPNGSATQSGFYNKSNNGSGDKFPTLLPLAIQVAARTVGFDIVSVIPMQGPTGILPYIDYEYAGGRLDSADNPYTIKLNVGIINETDYVVGTTYWGVASTTDNDPAGALIPAAGKALKLVYVGKSRIDGYKIFRIIGTYTVAATGAVTANSDVSIVSVFDGSADVAIMSDNEGEVAVSDGTTITGVRTPVTAELVRALEDHIQGFAGAGDYDTDTWSSGVDASKSASPMSRGTGEVKYFRSMGLRTYTKVIEAKTYQASVVVTTEQIQDLNRQFGLDVPAMVEANLINEISQGINANILDRGFKLGWTNHYNVYQADGLTMNMTLITTATSAVNKTYPDMMGGTKTIPIPKFAAFGNFENLSTLQRRIKSRVLAATNIIAQRGRRGNANFVVTNLQIATALQDAANYTIAPMENTINQDGGSLYPIGTVAGMTIYVDPRMGLNDNRVLVGRKGGDDEPGMKFMPYIMAESISTIAEGTMSPKTAVKTRYALVEGGHFPETQYLTFVVNTDAANPIF